MEVANVNAFRSFGYGNFDDFVEIGSDIGSADGIEICIDIDDVVEIGSDIGSADGIEICIDIAIGKWDLAVPMILPFAIECPHWQCRWN